MYDLPRMGKALALKIMLQILLRQADTYETVIKELAEVQEYIVAGDVLHDVIEKKLYAYRMMLEVNQGLQGDLWEEQLPNKEAEKDEE